MRYWGASCAPRRQSPLVYDEWGVYARTISAGTEVSEEGGLFTFPDSPMLGKICQRLGVYKGPRVISH